MLPSDAARCEIFSRNCLLKRVPTSPLKLSCNLSKELVFKLEVHIAKTVSGWTLKREVSGGEVASRPHCFDVHVLSPYAASFRSTPPGNIFSSHYCEKRSLKSVWRTGARTGRSLLLAASLRLHRSSGENVRQTWLTPRKWDGCAAPGLCPCNCLSQCALPPGHKS